jgi:MFS family permease
VVALLSPKVWSFYLSSIVMGIGGAIYWTAQGTYLALNSDEETVSRNAGILGALYQIR